MSLTMEKRRTMYNLSATTIFLALTSEQSAIKQCFLQIVKKHLKSNFNLAKDKTWTDMRNLFRR